MFICELFHERVDWALTSVPKKMRGMGFEPKNSCEIRP